MVSPEYLMFNSNGSINTDNLVADTIPASGPGFKGNARLMHLAQLAFQKNRQPISNVADEYLTVQSQTEIQDVITAKAYQNWLTTSPWGDWRHDVVLGYFYYIRDFMAWVWHDDTQSYSHDSFTTNNPQNNRDEYNVLQRYALYAKQSFATPIYPEHGLQFGNSNSSDDWRVWDDGERFIRFTNSVTAAGEWMFTTAELTPQR